MIRIQSSHHERAGVSRLFFCAQIGAFLRSLVATGLREIKSAGWF